MTQLCQRKKIQFNKFDNYRNLERSLLMLLSLFLIAGTTKPIKIE